MFYTILFKATLNRVAFFVSDCLTLVENALSPHDNFVLPKNK